jgi:DNA repair photolyase
MPSDQRSTIGHSQVEYKPFSSILTKTSGFISGYDYTLNPYSGCTFGCTYCYAAFFAKTEDFRNNWGYWVQVKENALELLAKRRKKPLFAKKIYMSSVTDPYQPIEKDLEITRAILKELLTYHQPHLVVQTRSPLVTRDIDLLQKFKSVQVNMTVTTDDERVTKVFEPFCSLNKVRLDAIKQVSDSGIKACITMTPLLPISDPHSFAQSLLETGVDKFIIQPFHSERGKFVAGTREGAMKLIKEMDWNTSKYEQVLKIIKEYIPNIGEGKEGFSNL